MPLENEKFPEVPVEPVEPEPLPVPVKTMIDLVREVPVDAVVVPKETRKRLREANARVDLVERRIAEARRDLHLAIAAATEAGSDVPATVLVALAAALELLPQNLMGE